MPNQRHDLEKLTIFLISKEWGYLFGADGPPDL